MDRSKALEALGVSADGAGMTSLPTSSGVSRKPIRCGAEGSHCRTLLIHEASAALRATGEDTGAEDPGGD